MLFLSENFYPFFKQPISNQSLPHPFPQKYTWNLIMGNSIINIFFISVSNSNSVWPFPSPASEVSGSRLAGFRGWCRANWKWLQIEHLPFGEWALEFLVSHHLFIWYLTQLISVISFCDVRWQCVFIWDLFRLLPEPSSSLVSQTLMHKHVELKT